MKKVKIILSLLFVLFLIISIWLVEPYSWNPFSETPIAFSESANNFSCVDQNQETDLLKRKADSIVNNAIMLKDFIGVSAGVYKQDCGTWLANAGFSKKGEQQRSDKHTLHRLASISKPMTAIAIMQLYEQGKIDLDVPIQNYLPDYPVSDKGTITIRHLLRHRAGIPHYTSTLGAISFANYENMTAALEVFKDRPLSFSPGTNYEYTTYGYSILGAIIEEITGLSFQAYMNTFIWKPADMQHTSIEDADETYSNKADLYLRTGTTFIKSPNTDLSVKYPGGGIQSTAEDMLKFGQAILDNRLIEASTLEEMITVTDTLKKGTPYGFGWNVRYSKDLGRIIQHGGSQSGTSTFFQILLDKKMVVVTLANNMNSDQEVFWLTRDLTYLFKDSAALSKPIAYVQAQKSDQLDRIVGVYQHTENGEFLEVFKKGTQLYVEIKPYPVLPIFPTSETQFFYRHFDGQLAFNFDRKGNANGVVYTYKGTPNLYQRKISN